VCAEPLPSLAFGVLVVERWQRGELALLKKGWVDSCLQR
jgi:hypothetical protein